MKKTDLEIFAEWHEKSLGKYIITENAQAGAIIEFAKYYVKSIQPTNKEVEKGLKDIFENKMNNESGLVKLVFQKGFLTYHNWLINKINKNEKTNRH